MKKIILLLTCCLAISLACNITITYGFKKNEEKLESCMESISPTYDYLNSITIRNFKSAIKSQQNLLVYVGRPDCTDCNYFEPVLREIVTKYELYEKIIYLNVKNYRKNNTLETWENFKNEFHFTQTPAFILIQDGNIISTIEWDKSLGLTEERMVEWLSHNKLI